jgi:hypothetical protein
MRFTRQKAERNLGCTSRKDLVMAADFSTTPTGTALEALMSGSRRRPGPARPGDDALTAG